MTRVIAIHGATGAGKSTFIRAIQEYMGTNCLCLQEDANELLGSPTNDDNQDSRHQRTTVIDGNNDDTYKLVEKLNPLSVTIFTIIIYFATGTFLPVILLFIFLLFICRLRYWWNSYVLSKGWLYFLLHLSKQRMGTNYQWIWRDRTCIDVYSYCIVKNVTSVPINMPTILLEQTQTTSVAIIFDISRHLIEEHLKKRIYEPTTSWSFSIVTWFFLLFRQPIDNGIHMVTFVEQWYTKMNVPIIKLSQLADKLDYDNETGNIKWNKNSIDALLKTIEEAIQQREQTPSIIDESLMPWRIVRNGRLFRI